MLHPDPHKALGQLIAQLREQLNPTAVCLTKAAARRAEETK